MSLTRTRDLGRNKTLKFSNENAAQDFFRVRNISIFGGIPDAIIIGATKYTHHNGIYNLANDSYLREKKGCRRRGKYLRQKFADLSEKEE